jgi:hypothetical protein
MKTLVKILQLLFSLIILISCKKTSTEPEQNYEPGRRDYFWNITEINSGNESLYLNRIWGIAPTNIWAIGNSSWSATTIWHYNGAQWRCDSIPRNVNPTSIYGLSSNQVWLGNGNNTIWKYDDSKWQKFGEYTISGYDKTCINNFEATSAVNIYGVGFVELYGANKWKATIIRYDGTNWNFINSVPETKVSFETVAIETKSNTLVMSGAVNEQTGFIAKVYYWNGVELKELLSENGSSFVTKLGDEIFATLNSKIYKYSDKNVTLWKDNTGTSIDGNIICGRSRNDFFIGSDNGITHYNGTDFTVVYNTNLTIRQGIIFENDVFFIGKDYSKGKNYIIRGQLK